jgi:hypothetical protein
MRLHGMAESLKTQEQYPAAGELSFLECLGLLVDQQWNWRENQALGRRLKNAKLCTNACVEDIDYRGARGLDKSVIRVLTRNRPGSERMKMCSCSHQQVWVVSRLAPWFKERVATVYSALYTRAQSLFRDLAMARADGSLRSLLARLARLDVLVIDDWTMAPLRDPERRDFWEICEDRD